MRTFEEIARLPDEELPLLEGALLIAREEYPRLDVAAYVHRIEALAAGAGRRPDVRRLNRYFFEKLGFHGNEEDYEDPRNSYLNEVVDRRTGIPISLATVYVEIANRAGLRARGIGFPGHYLVRCGRAIVDCFHGRILDRDGCRELLEAVTGGRARFRPALLAPSPPRATLARMLDNLKAVYLERDEPERSLRFVEMALALVPDSASHVRDRGMIRLQLGEAGRALDDLERYLRVVPGARDATRVREHATVARRVLAQFN